MNYSSVKKILWFLGVTVFVWCGMFVPSSWSGPIRITMSDGTSIEAPFYWEDGDQIKFNISGGGTAGVPKMQVTSISEVIVSNEFDADILLQSSIAPPDANRANPLEDQVTNQVLPRIERYEALKPEEFNQLISAFQNAEKKKEEGDAPKPVLSPLIDQREPFARLGYIEGKGNTLLLMNPFVSQGDMEKERFTVILYDADGNVLQKKPCEVYKMDIDQVKLKEMGIKGRVYSLVATVEPNPKIARYEISTGRP